MWCGEAGTEESRKGSNTEEQEERSHLSSSFAIGLGSILTQYNHISIQIHFPKSFIQITLHVQGLEGKTSVHLLGDTLNPQQNNLSILGLNSCDCVFTQLAVYPFVN